MNRESIKKIANQPKRFLVIGDVMVDKYFYGSVERVSPEAPVPVFKYGSEKNILGGAANVATNLVAINQEVSLMSCVGADTNGEVECPDTNGRAVMDLLSEVGIDSEMLMSEIGRQTTTKSRYVSGNQQLLRVDDETTKELSVVNQDKLLSLFEKRIEEFDLILLSDYLKGVLSYNFTQKIIAIAKAHNKKVLVDVKDKCVQKYRGAYLLKPNRKELYELSGCSVDTIDDVIKAMHTLKAKAECQCVLATLSGDGMAFLDENNNVTLQTCDRRKVYDVTGAGDTAFAYIAVALANGYMAKEVLKLANTASSIKITKAGTSVVSVDEIVNELYHDANKIQMLSELVNVIKEKQGKRVVFTNGCFDILHLGHVRYLKEAKAMGDILIVGLNSDASVKRLKGESRPINSEKNRAAMLAEMDFIDYIVIFEEDTPYEVIKAIEPDILVKGGDYNPDDIVGGDIVKGKGGQVLTIPLVEGQSTTNIISKCN